MGKIYILLKTFNNVHLPACKFTNHVTINCKISLPCLIASNVLLLVTRGSLVLDHVAHFSLGTIIVTFEHMVKRLDRDRVAQTFSVINTHT